MIFQNYSKYDVKFYRKKDFIKLKENFANPRNAAGGSLRQKTQMKRRKYH